MPQPQDSGKCRERKRRGDPGREEPPQRRRGKKKA